MKKITKNGLTASAGVWLRANEMETSVALWVNEAREGLYSLFTLYSNKK